MNLTAGTALQDGKYVLDSFLGQSELGITLKATQAHLGQPVVLSTLNRQPQTDIAHLRQPFLIEARRLVHCQHPGLVRVVDMFEEAGLPFVVMDYVAGQSLAEMVKTRGPLPEAQAVQYIRQVGSALSVLHRNGLIHKDVKPENLICPKGADFVILVGFNMLHSAPQSEVAPVSKVKAYTPIEFYSSEAQLTPASDIYALSATLYFLLTGQLPVSAPLRNHTPLTTPRQLQPNLSSTVESAILSGMATDAQARPQTIAAWFGLLPDSKPVPTHEVTNGAGQAPTVIELPKASASTNGLAPAPANVHPPASNQATEAIIPPALKAASNQTLVRKSRLPKVLVMVAAIGLSVGGGLGLALRLSAASGIGPKLFNTKQFFPAIEGWPGTSEPITAPVVPDPSESSVRQELAPVSPPDTPITPRPVVPPVEVQPSPEPSVEATPVPEPSPLEEPVAPAPTPDQALPENQAPAPPPPAAAPSPEAVPAPVPVPVPQSEGARSDGVL